MFNGYSFNERCMLSLGVVNDDVQIGDQLTLIWGEPETDGQDLDRAAQAGRDPRPRRADAVRARSARELRRQLANEVGERNERFAVALRRLLL